MTQLTSLDVPGTLVKEQGEPKEAHEARLGAAGLLFDVQGYMEDFGRAVVPAYRKGTADRELPADAGVAHGVVPPDRRHVTSARSPRPSPSWSRSAAWVHGLCQRLPGCGHPGHRRAGGGCRGHIWRIRRDPG